MRVFEVVIALLLGGAALAAIARRIGAPYPALVALAGAALALIPGVPTLVLDPALALALFVAPVLADAAFDSSPRDLRANWRAVSSLALGAVVLTIAVVAVVARWLVPDLPWAAAIALGAIVAPPDAAAATAVLKQLRPPHRLLVILEGESLFNDASALIVYRLAVAAMVTGVLSGWTVVPTLLVITVGSAVLGYVLCQLSLVLNARIHLILVTAFGVVLGTLVFQGLALRPLLLRLGLKDDGMVDREVRLARVETLRAAVQATAACPGAETAELVRHRYELQLRRAEAELGAPEKMVEPDGWQADAAVVRAATEAARRRPMALRGDGTIGDAAFQRVEEELDWADLDWAQFLRSSDRE